MESKCMKKISSGKVRDIYDVDNDHLVIVTSDKISAFDVVMPSLIPNKGIILNKLSSFWFSFTKDIIPNHMVTEDLSLMPKEFQHKEYEGRTILVDKLSMLPYEFIVRGYMFGSMWESYKVNGKFFEIKFDKSYKLAEKLSEPILTPSRKNSIGHDENISVEELYRDLGEKLASQIENTCLSLYKKCAEYAYEKGIIIADTKFEFGLNDNKELVLADEIFTPDSSRFWDLSTYQLGISPDSYDKQYLRDWLIQNKLNGVTPAPQIPDEIINKTAEKYQKCLSLIVD